MAHRQVDVYLTGDQIEYLYDPASKDAEGYEKGKREKEDLVIANVNDGNWIFVINARDLEADEGAGVWVDAEGHEHHGP